MHSYMYIGNYNYCFFVRRDSMFAEKLEQLRLFSFVSVCLLYSGLGVLIVLLDIALYDIWWVLKEPLVCFIKSD